MAVSPDSSAGTIFSYVPQNYPNYNSPSVNSTSVTGTVTPTVVPTHTNPDYILSSPINNSINNSGSYSSLYGVTLVTLPSPLTPLNVSVNIVSYNAYTKVQSGVSIVGEPTQLAAQVNLPADGFSDILYPALGLGEGALQLSAPDPLALLDGSKPNSKSIQLGALQLSAPTPLALLDGSIAGTKSSQVGGIVYTGDPRLGAKLISSSLPKPVSSDQNLPGTIAKYITGTGTADTFIIALQNTKISFTFALLPAVETNLQYSPSGSMRGQTGVPEVKPGIPSSTVMKFKNTLVPGGTPILQTIAVQSVTHTLVGAFIGSEGIANPDNGVSLLGSTYPIYNQTSGLNYSPTNTLLDQASSLTNSNNAYTSAREFDKAIVRGGTPVLATIVSGGITYSYQGVILDYKFYTVRDNRAYYVIDILTSDYINY